ncbi:class I adenylate-forming enzyme family protein [Thioflexithrix psekupsensis]|uniref:Long-chain fatty acid--CoA ligase n=1 Tax=Thioflexithrix psekupsensis TaxID=1570016 RepID=A0A251X4A5_9GAMM|nr:class I adenylate-forming enzyme family protein [Thioflexithrix psekupsensis]OUD12281.1 hypothetical protein TPSD3_14280 [Thioflexithrix psekupsensis]
MALNLAEQFFYKAATQPDHPLILGQNSENKTSYQAFQNQINTLAQQLQAYGVQAGDNIGLQYPSGASYIAYVYAIWACGACVTPLPFELTAAEKQQIFEHVHIAAVISHPQALPHISAYLEGETLPLEAKTVFAQVKSVCQAPPELAAINAAFIRFTSGTTGDAKGVVLSHETIYTRIHAANTVLNLNAQDRILWLLSMDYHFAVSIVAYLTFGASIILPQNSFGVTLLTAATNHKATCIYGAPTHYMLMVQDDTGAGLPAELRLAIVTTTALRAEAAEAFYQRFGRVLNETYGIIELGLPAINVSQSRDKQGSVGQVTPGYALRLDRQEELGYGEILLKSDSMLDAYYFPWRSRATILAQQDGWFRTGDLGRFDADGFLYIVGRSKEMISVGGMKFFPEEVEAVLEAHPAIAQACVFDVKERQWGEPAGAQLVLVAGATKPTHDELRAHCRAALASYKIPGQFHYVTELAYTASGKKIRNPNKLKNPPRE